MPVARTYEKFPIEDEPYKKNGKWYVHVRAKTGIKEVRWYSDTERARMDKAAGITVEKDLMDFNARHAFGFRDAGYITIYQGPENMLENFVNDHHESFWQNISFGYYTPGHINIPVLPKEITPIKLMWEEVMNYADRMKPHEEVAKIVATKKGIKIVESQYQGQVDTWLEKKVIIKANKAQENHFGEKHLHYMSDDDGNLYYWETGAKNFSAGSSVHLKMKVKAHKEIEGNKYTIVWYCKEI